ncbi:MAG: hypothetical protein QOG59_3423 [Solirubrobacteraceae bacterium]|nr:hypothetical protein [Solirubrobacteraceae bacterium]
MPAVELLKQNDPRELMGQGHPPERKAVLDRVELEAVRAAHDEAQIASALTARLEKAAEGHRIHLLAAAVEQGHERSLRKPAHYALVLANLDELEPGMTGQQLLVMLDIIGIRGAQPAHGDYDDPHDGILGRMDDPNRPERHINIHFSPEIMAGVYANFANVSHSDYEFTVTFARVDHEVEDEEIPGVVVSRVNLSARFMRELIDAMQDNYSKWQTREGIKNLPEWGGGPQE